MESNAVAKNEWRRNRLRRNRARATASAPYFYLPMAKPIPVGVRAEVSESVEHKHTLTSHFPELPPVYSTPDMIRLMETACFLALQPYAKAMRSPSERRSMLNIALRLRSAGR